MTEQFKIDADGTVIIYNDLTVQKSITLSEHIILAANEVTELGSLSNKLKKLFAKDADFSGQVTLSPTFSAKNPNANHGVTDISNTNTPLLVVTDNENVKFYSLATGGYKPALEIKGIIQAGNTSNFGAVLINVMEKSGTGTAPVSAAGTLFTVANRNQERFSVKENGGVFSALDTDSLQVVDAKKTGGDGSGWIQVEIGGQTRYIRTYNSIG